MRANHPAVVMTVLSYFFVVMTTVLSHFFVTAVMTEFTKSGVTIITYTADTRMTPWTKTPMTHLAATMTPWTEIPMRHLAATMTPFADTVTNLVSMIRVFKR
jgi:hypothetical protein